MPGWIVLLAASVLFLPPAHGEPAAAEPNPPEREDTGPSEPAANGDVDRAGWTMKLTLPITEKSYKRVRRFALSALDRAKAAGVRPVLIFEFQVLADQEEYGRGSEFGASYQLAEFLSGGKLSGAYTVAFLPQSIRGHAVLVALACDEIVMAADAEIGHAGIDEQRITNTVRFTYQDIADRHRRVPGVVAMALVDPSLEILQAETEYSTEYVTGEGLAELRKKHTVQENPEVLIRAGEPGRFTGTEARRHGFVTYLAGNLRDVARAMDLRPEAIHQDPSLAGRWRAVRVDLKGPITHEMINRAQRMMQDAVGRKVNFICLWIDSQGGAPAESARLAGFLAQDLDPNRVRTVAYVPRRAQGDAALIAMACGDVVVGPSAILGGRGDFAPDPEEVESMRTTLRQVIAPRASRSWSLPAAMIDAQLEVFEYTRIEESKDREYFCEAELAEQPQPDRWQRGRRVTTPGAAFSTRGAEAVEYWLAEAVADDFTAFKAIYGLESDPALLEPGWADFLIEALASPALAVLLLMIGFAAVYAELQAPGIGVGAFCAAVCFIVFFWSRFLGGTAGWLEVTLFAAGLSFLVLEVFVLPGFGIFGLGGGVMILASIVLASQTFVLPHNSTQLGQFQSSLMVLVGAAVGTLAVILLVNRWLPRLPGQPEAKLARQQEALVEYEDLIGQRAKTTTQLTPSGKALFGDRLVDVIADCEMVPRGSEIEVVEVHGNRVLVRLVEPGG